MNLDINLYWHAVQLEHLLTVLTTKMETIMATQEELAASLGAVKDQLTKASAEITTRIGALSDALTAAGNTTPAVDAALASVQAIAQILDDINPDAAPAAPV